MNFSVIEDVKDRLDAYLDLREQGIKQSRKVVELSRGLIVEIHNRASTIDTSRKELLEEFHKVQKKMKQDPRLKHAGFWRNAMQEFTEAITFHSLLTSFLSEGQAKLPSPEELGVTDKAFVLGLADVPGEIKREVLHYIKEENFKNAGELLGFIDKIYQKLMKFDYPHSVLPGFKKKRDVIRGISLSTHETLIKTEKEAKLRESLENVDQ